MAIVETNFSLMYTIADITPLSQEKLSFGRPASDQARILIGSPTIFDRENCEVHGIFSSTHLDTHSFRQIFLYELVNAPK